MKQIKKKMSRKQILLPVLIGLILIILFPSCTSFPKDESVNVYFPLPPDPLLPDGTPQVVYDESIGRVSMPLDYWRKIVVYMIDVEAVRKKTQKQE